MRFRLLFLLLLSSVLSAQAAPPAQTTWLGYPIVAVPRLKAPAPIAEDDPIPVLDVLRQYQLGIAAPVVTGITAPAGDQRVYWRLTPNAGGSAPTARTWWGPPEIALPYRGAPLTQYPWALPLQSRFFQGVVIGPDPDGTLRWRYDGEQAKATLKLANPHWLGLLRSGVPSVNDPTSASQVVPWPSLELGLADTGEVEGPVIWRLVLPAP
jgi:hypothetical protein